MNLEIKEIFFRIAGGSEDEKDLKPVLNYCVKIAEAYLWSSSKVTEVNLNKWNVTLKDLAFDSIVPFFTKNKKGKLAIIHSYNNWGTEISEEADLDFFLHRIVWRSAEQRLVNLMKENDPVFAKILKTVSTGISQYGFKKLSYFGSVYVVSGSCRTINGPVISTEEFWKIPQSYFLKKQKKLLDGLLTYLSSGTEYFPAIPLNELIKRVKDINLSINIRELNTDDFDFVEINDIIKQAREKVVFKINVSYLRKGRLNKKETDKIIAVFDNIASDLMDGGININLMSYFEKHFTGEPKNIYYEKYQTILNYLYKIFKSGITSKI